ncbi:hypothetical protein DFH06DRAFT_1297456 [Mycena polygramma]|nr:hypothetical protein DFH06DRAFT_1297456 [Mycena polygramma]
MTSHSTFPIVPDSTAVASSPSRRTPPLPIPARKYGIRVGRLPTKFTRARCSRNPEPSHLFVVTPALPKILTPWESPTCLAVASSLCKSAQIVAVDNPDGLPSKLERGKKLWVRTRSNAKPNLNYTAQWTVSHTWKVSYGPTEDCSWTSRPGENDAIVELDNNRYTLRKKAKFGVPEDKLYLKCCVSGRLKRFLKWLVLESVSGDLKLTVSGAVSVHQKLLLKL